MKETTLCFLIETDRICLAMKKRGFGTGKWNGVGGKVHEGETVEQAAVREMHEEIGTVARTQDLKPAAIIHFDFTDKPEWAQRCHVFLVHTWQGDPIESEEMAPQWYALDAIPYAQMWVDDPLWLPQVLAGKRIDATFFLTEDGSRIVSHTITEMQ